VAPAVEPAQCRAEGQKVRVIAWRERGHGGNTVRLAIASQHDTNVS
jgi:hypothetical protein